VGQKIYNSKQELSHLAALFTQHSIERKVTHKIEEIKQIREQLHRTISFKMQNFHKELELVQSRFPDAIDKRLNIAKNQVALLEKMIESNNPKLKSKKGFAQISKESKVVEISSLEVDEIFDLMSDEVMIRAKVLQKSKI